MREVEILLDNSISATAFASAMIAGRADVKFRFKIPGKLERPTAEERAARKDAPDAR